MKFKILNPKNKKSVVSIGTLILFISTILTATTASFVVMRTSGILQQKSYSTASNVREGITKQFNIVSIFGWSNKTNIEKIEIMLNYLTSAEEIFPYMISVNLEPFNILYLYDKENNFTFYNEKRKITFCDSNYTLLDLDSDGYTDRIAIINSTLYWLFNESDSSEIIKWSNTINTTKTIEKCDPECVVLGEIKIQGNVTSNCTDNISIEVSPYRKIGHYIIKQYDENEIIYPGENLKIIMKTPELYEDKEYGITIIVKSAMSSGISFTIPNIYHKYMQII